MIKKIENRIEGYYKGELIISFEYSEKEDKRWKCVFEDTTLKGPMPTIGSSECMTFAKKLKVKSDVLDRIVKEL